MKKILFCLLAAIAVLATNCGKNNEVDTKISVTGVTINKTTLTLLPGDTETLTATVKPDNATDKSVTWSSGNGSVATVDPETGKVTAIAEGTANITVTTKEGGKTATCAVTVNAAKVSVTGVSINVNELSIETGEKQTLIATVTPDNATDKTVAWSSSNNNVATVNPTTGEVTGISEGTAVITVTTNDGDLKATCTVTVSIAYVNVTGVTLSETILTLMKDETKTLIATVQPLNATDQSVLWSSSDTEVADVDPETGEVTAIGEGTATITVTTEEGEFTATCEVTVKAFTEVSTNILINPSFEDPDDDTPATIAPWIAMTQADLLKDAAVAPNTVSANRTNAQFWIDNPAILPPPDGKYTGRLQASSSAGLYQLVNVVSGKTYKFKAYVLQFRSNADNQTIKTEKVRIKSADGATEYASAEIGTNENVWTSIEGSVTIPVGATQIRFQISHYDGGSAPDRAPITLIDKCEFYEVTDNNSGIGIGDFPVNPPL